MSEPTPQDVLEARAGELSPASRIWKRERADEREARALDAYEDQGEYISDEQQAAVEAARLAAFSRALSAGPLHTNHTRLPDRWKDDPGCEYVLAPYDGAAGKALRVAKLESGWDRVPAWVPEYPDSEELTADQMHALFRHSVYLDHVKNRAGEILTEEAHARMKEARSVLDAQSMEIALALEAGGVGGFDKNAQRLKPAIVDPIGRRVLPLVPFRRVNFNPACAAQRRSPMLKHLETFLGSHPQTKLATFTFGPRVWLSEIRETIQQQHRRLSKLNGGRVFAKYGVSMQFRATELGTLTRACRWPRTAQKQTGLAGLDITPDDPGELLAHIHSHVFLSFSCDLKERFLPFVKETHSMWGAWWYYGKSINDAREACKYPVKPSDMTAARMSSDEVCELYKQLRGLHLVQPMSVLKKSIRRRRAKALKGLKYRVQGGAGDGGLVLKWKYDPNARGPRDLKAQANRAALSARERRAALARFVAAVRFVAAAAHARAQGDQDAADACTWLASWFALYCPANDAERARAGRKALKLAERASKARKRPVDQVAARLAPCPYFDRIHRPALLVWGFSGDWAALERQQVVADLIRTAAPLVQAAEKQLAADAQKAAPSYTHSSHQSHNCPALFAGVTV